MRSQFRSSVCSDLRSHLRREFDDPCCFYFAFECVSHKQRLQFSSQGTSSFSNPHKCGTGKSYEMMNEKSLLDLTTRGPWKGFTFLTAPMSIKSRRNHMGVTDSRVSKKSLNYHKKVFVAVMRSHLRSSNGRGCFQCVFECVIQHPHHLSPTRNF